MRKTMSLCVGMLSALLSGCATSALKPVPIVHIYSGPPRMLEEVAILRPSTKPDGYEESQATVIGAVDGVSITNFTHIAVLPGDHTVIAHHASFFEAVDVVADTGVSSPDIETSSFSITVSHPGKPPVKLTFDDKRIKQEMAKQRERTERTVSMTAVAGKAYVVRCDTGKDGSLSARGIWIEELAGPVRMQSEKAASK